MLKKANKLKPLLKLFEWLIFIGLLFFSFLILSPLLPIKNAPRTHVIVTGSMEPTIKAGSVSLTRPIDPAGLKAGDIIAFTSPSNPKDTILHRIDSISSTDPLTFKTKGDNNNNVDDWDVMASGVLGAHVLTIPYLGQAGLFVKTPLGFGLVIGLPALIFIILQIFNIKKGIKEQIEAEVAKRQKNSPKKIIASLLIFGLSLAVASLVVTRALFSHVVTVSGLTITVKDFVAPPIPTLTSPANNSYVNTFGLVMDWSDVTDYEDQHNPVYYYYRSCADSLCNSVIYSSGKLTNSFINAPGTPEGVYYWQVQACDSLGNCSLWSLTWQVTVDNTPPTTPQNLHYTNPAVPCGGSTMSYTIIPDWDDSTDTNISHYEYQSYNPPNNWPWSTTVTTSQYSGAFTQGYGTYGFRVRTVDKAGNKSDWTSADFTSSCQVTYNSIPTDTDPPVTLILNPKNVGSSAVYASYVKGINIQFSITDANPDYTKLFYSLDLGTSWTESAGSISAPTGHFDFDLSALATKSGTICFDTVGHDKAGNIETGTLAVVTDPLSTDTYCLYFDIGDTVAPISAFSTPVSSTNRQIGVSLPSWDGSITGTALDNSSGVARVDLSIQKDGSLYWNGSTWVSGSSASPWVTATGANNWSYQIGTTSPSAGSYIITSHAVDNAGNIESSATIQFVYQSIPVPSLSPQPTIEAVFDKATHIIHLSFINLPADIPDKYELIYLSGGMEKGLESGFDKLDHYLGSCSAGGACTPDPVDGKITIIIGDWVEEIYL